jgi:hypothetical protein
MPVPTGYKLEQRELPRAMGFSLGESHGNVIPQNAEGGPHMVDNGLTMVSGMGMVVKPGA